MKATSDAHPPLRRAAAAEHVEPACRLCGWVARRREHGEHLAFVDLRDYSGLVQCVVDGSVDVAQRVGGAGRGHGAAPAPRAPRTRELPTGEVELGDCTVEVLAQAEPPPFPVDDRAEIDEAVRLRYRYVDLRRPRMQRNLRLRARVLAAMRAAMVAPGFLRGGDAAAVDADARRGAGVRRPLAAATGAVLRAAPEPPDRQAAAHGGGLRPLLPDRPLPARRGPACRPPVRVHPARHRDVLRHRARRAGRGDRRRRSRPPRRRSASGPRGDRGHDLARGHGPLRHRQARPALRDGARRPRRVFAGTEVRAFAGPVREGAAGARGRRARAAAGSTRWSSGPRSSVRRAWPGSRSPPTHRWCWTSPLDKFLSDDGAIAARVTRPAPRRATSCWWSPTSGARRARCSASCAWTWAAAGRRGPAALLWVTEFPLFEGIDEDGTARAAHHPFTMPHPDDLDLLR